MRLKVSLAQIDIISGKPEANLKKAEGLIAEAASRGSSLVCLPEMWTTGFEWTYIDSNYSLQGPVIEAISEMANRYKIFINGSLLTKNQQDRPTNTSILFGPSGDILATFDKVHLFPLIGEDLHLTPGSSLTLVDTLWGPTGLAICYDLRFPELFRAYGVAGAKVVLLSAAFPHSRVQHWQTLIRARAIENEYFMIATNRVGKEGDTVFGGSSAVIDPWGEVIIEGKVDEEGLIDAEIDLAMVDEVRLRIPVYKARRPEVYGYIWTQMS